MAQCTGMGHRARVALIGLLVALGLLAIPVAVGAAPVGPATQLQVADYPSPTTAGTSQTFSVTAKDSGNNKATGYRGTVHFTSSDPQAVLPADYTFTAGDNGKHTFTSGATLRMAGSQSITATDTVTSSITGTQTVTVNAAAASSITATNGTPQSAVVNTNFSTPLSAKVTDQFGNPVKNVSVTFVAPTSGASAGATFATLASAADTTGTNGVAKVTATANTVAGGPYTVTANLTSGALSTPASFALTNTAGAPTSIVASGGGGQSTAVNTAFATQLQATVKDQYGNLVPNASVTFVAPTSGARATFTTANPVNTDSSGVAKVTAKASMVAGGPYTVTANLSTNPLTTAASFSLINTPDVPASITATGGTPQSTVVNTGFGTQLAATVKDQYGNPIPNVSVTFTVPSSVATATITTTNPVNTDSSGVARVSAKASTVAGSYTVTANLTSGPLATPASFSLTNTPDVPASITATGGGGQSTITTTAFTNKLMATVKDQFGNLIPNAPVTFAAPASGASGTFPGNVTTATVNTDTNGVATSPTFTANKVPGGYDVVASTPGVTGTAAFHLTNTLGTPSYTIGINVNPKKVKPAVNFTYTFTIKNTGTADSINTTASYPLPSTVNFGSATGDHNFACVAVGTPPNVTMQCTGGQIAVGETATITLTVATPLNAEPGEVIATNTLTVSGTADGQGGPNGGTGTGSATSPKTVTIQDPGWSAPPA